MADLKPKNIDFLWHSFLKGDDKSFSVIYQQHIQALLAYGYKLASDRELVNDAVQEVFLDLFQRRSRLNKEIGNLKSYLFVSLRNSLRKKLIRNRKFDTLNGEENGEDLYFQVEYSFEDKLIELEISSAVREKLRKAINNLPARQKEIIYLRFEEELDYKEISDILYISGESARKLLHRSLLSLRKILPS